jgi:hypothetical protein
VHCARVNSACWLLPYIKPKAVHKHDCCLDHNLLYSRNCPVTAVDAVAVAPQLNVLAQTKLSTNREALSSKATRLEVERSAWHHLNKDQAAPMLLVPLRPQIPLTVCISCKCACNQASLWRHVSPHKVPPVILCYVYCRLFTASIQAGTTRPWQLLRSCNLPT